MVSPAWISCHSCWGKDEIISFQVHDCAWGALERHNSCQVHDCADCCWVWADSLELHSSCQVHKDCWVVAAETHELHSDFFQVR